MEKEIRLHNCTIKRIGGETLLQQWRHNQVWYPPTMYQFLGLVFDDHEPEETVANIWAKDPETKQLWQFSEGIATILLFTGYYDKNGKPIHDRDLVKSEFGTTIFIVAWGYFKNSLVQGETWLIYSPQNGVFSDGTWQPDDRGLNNTMVFECCRDIEVIGSFYEKRELFHG